MNSNRSLEWNYVFNSIKDPVILIGPNGIIKNCNTAFLKLVDKSETQVFGYDCSKIVHGKTSRVKNCPFFRSKKSKKRESFTFKKKGKWFNVDVDPVLDDGNKILGFVHIMSDITEHMKADISLQESEEKFRTLAENINVGIYRNTVGTKGKFIEANPAIVRMFGFKNKKEFLAYNVSELYLHPKERNKFNKEMLKKGFVKNEELQLKKADGTTFLGSISAEAIKDKNGNVKFYDGIIEDITERKKAETTLLESENNLRTLFRAMTDIVIEIDYDGRYINIAPTSPKLLYKPYADIIGKKLHEIFPKQKADMFLESYRKCLKENKTITIEYSLIINNKTIWVEGRITPKTKNSVLLIAHDMTERKHATVALQESEKRFKYLFDQSPVSIWEEDFSKVHKYLNSLKKKGIENFKEYFENHLDEVKKCSEMVHVLDINEMTIKLFNAKNKKELITNLNTIFTKESLASFIEQLIAIIKNETRFKGECINRTIDGKLINVSLEFNVVPGYEKDYSRVLISLIDITEKKKAEEDLRNDRERLKMLNKIIQHDISNDFIVIQSAINIFRRSSDVGMIDEIEKRVVKSLKTIDSYRKYESFIDSNQDLDEIEIAELFEDLIVEFTSIKFNIEGKCKVFADEALSSIFTNLIINSIKHGNASQIDIKISSHENMCKIMFMDNGMGIPDKIKFKIFQEGFFYGKSGNTGIGLHIVKKTVERYGGYIYAEDNKPKGTVFVISLRQAL